MAERVFQYQSDVLGKGDYASELTVVLEISDHKESIYDTPMGSLMGSRRESRVVAVYLGDENIISLLARNKEFNRELFLEVERRVGRL